jgi:hypothetical protein
MGPYGILIWASAHVSSSDVQPDPFALYTDDGDDAECTLCGSLAAEDTSGSSAPSADTGVTGTELGTQGMLISFVTCALMIQNMSGRDMSSHVVQNSHNKLAMGPYQ